MPNAAIRRAFVVLLATLIGGATVPAMANAARHHRGQTTRKHKKVKVKCAAKTVTCPSTKTGTPGTPGIQGANGTPGAVKGSIVDRARGGPLTTTYCMGLDPSTGDCTGGAQNLALTGATWSQGAREADALLAQVTATFPPADTSGSGTSSTKCNTANGTDWSGVSNEFLWVQILLDGQEVGGAFVGPPGSGGGQTIAIPFFDPSTFPSPGSTKSHTLTALAFDNCQNSSGGAHPTVTSLAIDAAGFSG